MLQPFVNNRFAVDATWPAEIADSALRCPGAEFMAPVDMTFCTRSLTEGSYSGGRRLELITDHAESVKITHT